MAHEDEKEIVKASKSRLEEVFSDVVPNPQKKVSCIVMDAYLFQDDSKPFKSGHIFRANKTERIPFGLRLEENLELCTGKQNARFLVRGNKELGTMEDVMKLGFKLKHIGILKPIFVAQNPQDGDPNLQVGSQNLQVGAQNLQVVAQNLQIDAENIQLPNVVLGFSWYDQSFVDWLANRHAQRGTFLHHTEKEMLRTWCGAIDEMWRGGYTCDTLADPASYVMIGLRIKILPHLCRPKNDQNDTDFMPLRNALADLLLHNIAPLWIVPGFQDFILLLRNGNASIEDILGQPLLLEPGRRQLMYRTFSTRDIPKSKKRVLNKSIPFSSHWKISSPHENIVVDSVCRGRNFARTAEGALMFADFVSRHYVQHLKDLKTEDWYNHIKDDTVDTALAESVPGLLSKRYALNFNKKFLGA